MTLRPIAILAYVSLVLLVCAGRPAAGEAQSPVPPAINSPGTPSNLGASPGATPAQANSTILNVLGQQTTTSAETLRVLKQSISSAWYQDTRILITLIFGITGLAVAILGFRRKSGLLFRGDFTIATGEGDFYVSEFFIDNLKDRAVTIYGIYLRIGYVVYLELETFEEPLILKAYESHRRAFGPLLIYAHGFIRGKMNRLLAPYAFKKSLVLSTSEGRFVVPSPGPRWSPRQEALHQREVSVLSPVRHLHEGISVGSKVKYVINWKRISEPRCRVYLVKADDWQFRNIPEFPLTQESLESRSALHTYIANFISMNKMIGYVFTVFDASELTAEVLKPYLANSEEPKTWGRLRFKTISWIRAAKGVWPTIKRRLDLPGSAL